MNNLKKLTLIIIVSIFSLSKTGLSQSSGVADRFSDFDANSTVRVNHQPLSNYLGQTVLLIGRSYRILGNEKADSYKGSRIRTSKSLSPSRYEGSRLFVHAFSEDHKHFFRAYQEGLERLSTRRSLSTLNQNEQLAYWLNLYNVIVINKLVEEYPISKLKSLRSSKRGKKSFWDEKITTVEGVSLSLKDIEKILFTNFNAPEVAFGLWQGSIGGPRLLNYAYTGKNVRRALENNATEFVNSNRGLRPPTGTRMAVSDYYEWVMPAFGTSADHVLMFIKEYADPVFVQGVSNVSSLNFKIYDWQIADILGGVKHSGSSNQLGGIQTAGGQTKGKGALAPGFGTEGSPGFNPLSATPGASLGGTTPVIDVQENLNAIIDTVPVGALEGLPAHSIEILMGIKTNNRKPITIITSEECAPGEDCTLENVDGDGGV